MKTLDAFLFFFFFFFVFLGVSTDFVLLGNGIKRDIKKIHRGSMTEVFILVL